MRLGCGRAALPAANACSCALEAFSPAKQGSRAPHRLLAEGICVAMPIYYATGNKLKVGRQHPFSQAGRGPAPWPRPPHLPPGAPAHVAARP
jgi:hypothetical protein